MRIKNVSIDDIEIGKRHRTDMGDLREFAESIERQGLLQPIGITPDCKLVFGNRRLRAVADILGWNEIPAVTIDIDEIVLGERAENIDRKDFTTSERVAIADTVANAMPERRGGDRQSKEAKSIVDSGPQCSGQKTRDIAASKAGFGSGKEYDRAKKVVDNGSAALVKAVDDGDVAISTAAKLAELPKAEQTKAVKGGKAAVKKATTPPIEKARYPASDIFCKAMRDVVAILSYVKEDYGTMEKMIASKEWDNAQTTFARQITHGLSNTVTQWHKELKECEKRTTKK